MAIEKQHGAVLGLVLLFLNSTAVAEASLRDVNYVLVEWHNGTRQLLLLGDDDDHLPLIEELLNTDPDRELGLALTHSANPNERVRGLLLLSGEAGQDVLDIAMQLLSDPAPAVREEAAELIADHPLADRALRNLFPIDEELE